jgi:hypothetical protein
LDVCPAPANLSAGQSTANDSAGDTLTQNKASIGVSRQLQELHEHPHKGHPAAAEAVTLAQWLLLLPTPLLRHAESAALRSLSPKTISGSTGGEVARTLLHGWREAWTHLFSALAS